MFFLVVDDVFFFLKIRAENQKDLGSNETR